MVDDDKIGSSGWLQRLRAKAGWMEKSSLKQRAQPPRQERSQSVYRSSHLHSEGARQAYERSIAKEKGKAQRGKNRSDLLDIPLNELPVVVIDLETTGFEPYADEIISIGARKITGISWEPEESSVMYELLNPGMQIPAHIEYLTGISNDDVAHAPDVGAGLSRFIGFVDNRLIIAHASGHDKAFLRNALWRYHRHTWRYRMLDTMLVARWLYPEQKELDLDTLAQMHHIEIERRHHALHDAKATGELWILFVEQAMKRRVTTLREMYMYLSRY